MTQCSPETLDKAFQLLERCAIDGTRCPKTHGPDADRFLPNASIGELTRAGRIFVEISGQNFRRITILAGPHKGKSTAANPNVLAHVWQTVGKDGARVNGERVRQQPSAPRFLTREETKR
jgi:hypothetical protein